MEVQRKRRENLKNKELYIKADESTMKNHGPMIVITVGDINNPANFYNFTIMKPDGQRMNARYMADCILDVLGQIFPGEGEVARRAQQIKNFVSDGAAYMVKTGNILKEELNEDIYHIICMTHCLNLLAEDIRKHCPLSSKLVSYSKQVMANSTSRKEAFRKSATVNTACKRVLDQAKEKSKELVVSGSNEEEMVDDILYDPWDERWVILLSENENRSQWKAIWDKVMTAYSEHISEDDIAVSIINNQVIIEIPINC